MRRNKLNISIDEVMFWSLHWWQWQGVELIQEEQDIEKEVQMFIKIFHQIQLYKWIDTFNAFISGKLCYL